MLWKHRLTQFANAWMLAILALTGPLSTLAAGRADAVQAGPSAQPTAHYNLAATTGSILGAGSDPRLRVTVVGDLAEAGRIAIVVPGVGHRAAEFDTPTGRRIALPRMARNLWLAGTAAAHDAGSRPRCLDYAPVRFIRSAGREDGWRERCDGDRRTGLAVVAWLGYVPPSDNIAALPADAIRPGAANLAELQRVLDAEYPEAQVTWVCHSFGTLVCASALVGADPDALVLLGSPGIPVRNVDQLATSAPVFAARGTADPIRLASVFDLMGGGFGADPAASSFGAHLLPTDARTGHSDYFVVGSGQLAAVADVAMAGGARDRGRFGIGGEAVQTFTQPKVPKDPPRTRQSPPALAAFRPWGSSAG